MERCFAGRIRMVLIAAVATVTGVWALAAEPQTPPSVSRVSEVSTAPLTPELRGDLAMARRQYLQAIEEYDEVPIKSAVVWNKLGMAYHHLFAMNEAKRDYQHALRLRPNYPEALNNLGAIYYAKKNYKKAEKYYRKAIALDPKSAPIFSNLGTAYFAQSRMDRGLAAYRTAFALDPLVFQESSALLVNESLPIRERAQQDYCLAKLFAAAGRKQQAIDYLRRALDEGFDDRKKLLEDQTLASLRATPEFAELMSEQKLR